MLDTAEMSCSVLYRLSSSHENFVRTITFYGASRDNLGGMFSKASLLENSLKVCHVVFPSLMSESFKNNPLFAQ